MSELFHIAQYNVARALFPLEDERMKGFVDQLHYINSLADDHPGFVWRIQTPEGHSINIRPYEDEAMLITLSVWKSIGALFDFSYTKQHAEMLRERHKWFEHVEGLNLVLWWINAGDIPTVEEGKARLEHLQAHGPTPHAFTFKQRFPPPVADAAYSISG